MANYTQTSGLLASMWLPFQTTSDIEVKDRMLQIITLINTEFAAAASGQDGYTVTSGLQATVDSYLMDMNDTYTRKVIRFLMIRLIAEFTSAGDGTMFNYTVTSNLRNLITEDISNMPNLTNRKAFHFLVDLLFTEFTAMAAAS